MNNAIALAGVLLLLWGVPVAAQALKEDAPVHGYAKINDSVIYPTIEAAVQAEVRAAMQASGNTGTELAGVIYKHGGHFHPSTWVYGERHRVRYDIAIYKTTPVVAVWHTHPSPHLEDSDGFSGTDVKNAATMQADSYLGVLPTGKIRRLPYKQARSDLNGNWRPMWGEVTSL